MITIGLGYKSRHGKDSVAKVWKETLGEDARLYSFAKQLKLYCRDNHDTLLPLWQLAKQTKQVPLCKDDPIYGYSAILQYVGTDIFRKEDPDHWVKIIKEQIYREQPKVAVITDCRFFNEVGFIKDLGGFLVEVIRVGSDGNPYQDTSRSPNHQSEIELDGYDGWDYTIRCKSGDMTALTSKARGVLENILNQHTNATSFSVPDSTGHSI